MGSIVEGSTGLALWVGFRRGEPGLMIFNNEVGICANGNQGLEHIDTDCMSYVDFGILPRNVECTDRIDITIGNDQVMYKL